MVKANWSGSWPCLCHGLWTLEVDGVDVSDKIPEDIRGVHMGTYGTYEEWHFDEHYSEVFEDYDDGLEEGEWIAENDYWLDTITHDYNVKSQIFKAIQEQDFRAGSCGGCI